VSVCMFVHISSPHIQKFITIHYQGNHDILVFE
jgi:hypothetical protein